MYEYKNSSVNTLYIKKMIFYRLSCEWPNYSSYKFIQTGEFNLESLRKVIKGFIHTLFVVLPAMLISFEKNRFPSTKVPNNVTKTAEDINEGI